MSENEKSLASVESLSTLKKGVFCPILFAPKREGYRCQLPIINFENILNHFSDGTKDYIIPFPHLDTVSQTNMLLTELPEKYYDEQHNIDKVLYVSYDNRLCSSISSYNSSTSLSMFIMRIGAIAWGNQFNYLYKYFRNYLSNSRLDNSTKFTKFKEFFGVNLQLNTPKGRIELFDNSPSVEIANGEDIDLDIQNKSKIESFSLNIHKCSVKNIKYDFKEENTNPAVAMSRKISLIECTILNDLTLTNFETYDIWENTYKNNCSLTIIGAETVNIDVSEEKIDLSNFNLKAVKAVSFSGKNYPSVVISTPLKVKEAFSSLKCSLSFDEFSMGDGIKTILHSRVEETKLSIKKFYLHMAPKGEFVLEMLNYGVNIDELIIDCPVETVPVLKFLVVDRDVPSQIQIGKITTINDNPTITIVPTKNSVTINNILVQRKRTFKQGQLNGK